MTQTTTKTRRELQKEARRIDILKAGCEEFTSRGFSATRLDDVAQRAGVSKGTIYLYFDSKEVLFHAMVTHYMFPKVEELEHLSESFEGSAEDLLKNHIRKSYSQLTEDPHVPRILATLIGEGDRFPDLSQQFFEELIQRNQQTLRAVIKKGEDTGEFRTTKLSEYTQIVIAPVIISAIWRLQFQRISPLDLEEYAETHIELLLTALKE